MFLVFLLQAVCAATFTVAKATLAYAPPMLYMGFRMAGAGLLLLLFAKLAGAWRVIERRDLFLFIQLSFFGVFLTYAGDLWSLQYLTTSESALFYNLMPFASAFFSYLWFGERMTARKWLGMCIGVTSVLPLLGLHHGAVGGLSGKRLLAFLVIVGVTLCSSYSWVIARELIKVKNYASSLINGHTMLWAGILAFATSYLFESSLPAVTAWPQFIKLVLLTILIANIIFINFYTVLLKRYTATLLSFSGCICPVITAFYGWLFLGEALTWTLAVSTVWCITGLLIFYGEELRQGYVGQE